MNPQTITAFFAIGAAIFIGFFGNMIFAKYRIPDVLIVIGLGILIGPEGLGLVSEGTIDSIYQYRDFLLSAALILILFEGGLTLDIRSLVESMKLGTFITVLTLTIEILLVATLLTVFLGVDFMLAIVFGCIVGGTSEAVVIPLANRLRISSNTKSMLVMESMLTDVITITVALTMMSLIALGDLDFVSVAGDLAAKFLLGGAIGFAAGILWLFVLQKLQNQPLSYMLTVGALFLIAGLVEMPPLESSGLVAALAFGLAIGNRRVVKRWMTSFTLRLSTDNHIQEFHKEVAFFVRTFFFVYLGMLIVFDTFTAVDLVVGIAVIAVVVVVRRATSRLAMRLGDLEEEDADAMFSMMARGLATAVLATTPGVILASSAVWDPDYEPFILNVALIVIVGTTLLTTVLSFLLERGVDERKRRELRRRLAEDAR